MSARPEPLEPVVRTVEPCSLLRWPSPATRDRFEALGRALPADQGSCSAPLGGSRGIGCACRGQETTPRAGVSSALIGARGMPSHRVPVHGCIPSGPRPVHAMYFLTSPDATRCTSPRFPSSDSRGACPKTSDPLRGHPGRPGAPDRPGGALRASDQARSREGQTAFPASCFDAW